MRTADGNDWCKERILPPVTGQPLPGSSYLPGIFTRLPSTGWGKGTARSGLGIDYNVCLAVSRVPRRDMKAGELAVRRLK